MSNGNAKPGSVDVPSDACSAKARLVLNKGMETPNSRIEDQEKERIRSRRGRTCVRCHISSDRYQRSEIGVIQRTRT